MGLQYFKPNGNNTGAALSVSFNSKGDRKGIFFELIKQVSWDNQAKRGKFSGGQKILSKFNTAEAAQFIHCIESGSDFEKPLYHTNGESSSTINFKRYKGKVKDKAGQWVEAPDYKGYALSVSKGDIQASLGLTWAEAVEFREYLKFALNHIFTGIYSDDIASLKERQAKQKEQEQTTTTSNKNAVKSVENFVEVEEEEDGVPF